MIKASIDGLELKISEREPLLAGTVGLNKISLSFSDEWSIFTKQIDFTNEQSGETRRISADVGVCTVPWELLRDEGDITCYVRGIGSDGSLVLRTNDANLGTVLGDDEDDVPDTGTPTPDVCDETAAKIGDLSKLETNEKSQLVGAINELKRAEGLGVLEVTLTAQDGVLTADKTFAQVKAAIKAGTPALKVHSDGDLLWFFLLDTGTTEIDFVGFADEQILAYLTAKQDGTWESTITARVTVEMLSELSDKLGNLGNLTTTAKTNLVAAINELKSAAAANVTEATVSGWGFTKNTGTYSKPANGIPKDDLASAVQTALDKADSALQSVPSTYRTASAQDSIDSGKVDKVSGKGLSTNDYTAAAKAKVDAIPANPKYTDTVYDDTAVKSRLSAVESMENVALTVALGRLTNASYTARYSSLLGMVFVRIYGTVNADMNTGYDYDIMNIGARLPNSHAALAVKSGKAAQAFAKSSGVISLRPLESGIKNYDIYITGFWFV